MNDSKFRRLNNLANAILHCLVVNKVIKNSYSILQENNQKKIQ